MAGGDPIKELPGVKERTSPKPINAIVFAKAQTGEVLHEVKRLREMQGVGLVTPISESYNHPYDLLLMIRAKDAFDIGALVAGLTADPSSKLSNTLTFVTLSGINPINWYAEMPEQYQAQDFVFLKVDNNQLMSEAERISKHRHVGLVLPINGEYNLLTLIGANDNTELGRIKEKLFSPVVSNALDFIALGDTQVHY